MLAIQEFDLLSDALPAEYGWSSGAAVNVVSKAEARTGMEIRLAPGGLRSRVRAHHLYKNYASIQTLANTADAHYEGLSAKVSHPFSVRVSALLTHTYFSCDQHGGAGSIGSSPKDGTM